MAQKYVLRHLGAGMVVTFKVSSNGQTMDVVHCVQTDNEFARLYEPTPGMFAVEALEYQPK